MYADETGAPTTVEGPLDESPATLERLRDLIILRLSRRGVTQKSIAHVLGLSQQTVSRRLREIPPHVRAFHEARSLDGLD